MGYLKKLKCSQRFDSNHTGGGIHQGLFHWQDGLGRDQWFDAGFRSFWNVSATRVIQVGGFNHKTVGEDLELCIRLRVHMEKLKKPYKVVYVPETLCWTEAPPDYNIFIKQRDRWARGLWETLKLHKYLFLNPKYRSMGLIFFPIGASLNLVRQ